jgi:hypothetical protein
LKIDFAGGECLEHFKVDGALFCTMSVGVYRTSDLISTAAEIT